MARVRCTSCGREIEGTIFSLCPSCGSDVELVPEKAAPGAVAPLELDESAAPEARARWSGLAVEVDDAAVPAAPTPRAPLRPPGPSMPLPTSPPPPPAVDTADEPEPTADAGGEAEGSSDEMPSWATDAAVLIASVDGDEAAPAVALRGVPPPSYLAAAAPVAAYPPLKPGEEVELLQQAATLVRLGVDNLTPAVERCLRVTAHQPYHTEAWGILADAYECSSRLEEAEQTCRHLLAIEPGDARAQAQLMRIRAARGLAATAPQPASWRPTAQPAPPAPGPGAYARPAPPLPAGSQWRPQDEDGPGQVSPWAFAALATVVLAVCCPPLPIGLGIMALVDIRSRGVGGQKLAWASIVLGVLLSIGSALLIGGIVRNAGQTQEKLLNPMGRYEDILESEGLSDPDAPGGSSQMQQPYGPGMPSQRPMPGPGGMAAPMPSPQYAPGRAPMQQRPAMPGPMSPGRTGGRTQQGPSPGLGAQPGYPPGMQYGPTGR